MVYLRPPWLFAYKTMVKFLNIMALCMLLSSCAPIRITPPEVQLISIDVRNASITHINFDASLRIYNPNNKTIEIGSVSYTLEVNGDRIFSSVAYVDEPVPPDSSITVPLHVSSALWDLFAMFTRMGERPELDFRLTGSVEAGPAHGRKGSFDFDRKGKIAFDSNRSGKTAPSRRHGPHTPPLPGRNGHVPQGVDDYI